MNEEKFKAEESFYQAVADTLGTRYNYLPFHFHKRTRWNNRGAGNGRFPGFGLVRRFSANQIHVQLHIPAISGLFASEEAALEAIKTAHLMTLSNKSRPSSTEPDTDATQAQADA
jgi:hypothetical protein